ncbi:MAG: DNA-3-methyladenine glycosylase family protein [Acidimicrobiales bacterium]
MTGPASDQARERQRLTVDHRLDLAALFRSTPGPRCFGPGDLWWATRTPDGPGTVTLHRSRPDEVIAEAWGPGAGWLIGQTPGLLGHRDTPAGFRPDGRLGARWRSHPVVLPRTDRLWDAAVSAVFGQKVQAVKAGAATRALARRFGTPAPGPRAGWILPAPATVAELGSFRFHPIGVERRRAETLQRLARALPGSEAPGTADPALVEHRLRVVRGVGPWTSAMITATALGHADAVPVGDFHIPDSVCWMLAGEPSGDDDRMLQLLEPYVGHRWRVIRLAETTSRPPRRGPRLALDGDGMSRGR